ncbi:MAG: hypothetical protein IT483_03205 [Gammaproteobacteria bacterium]|jgi:uncharacterized protein YciI|nr:hypothetical protein [Gammaproteobacteria bacterium]
MLFIVKLTDKPGALATRQQYLSDHRAWLAANSAHIRVTGALRHDPDGQPFGGLWIVEADTKAFVEQLLTADPFWIHGLRESRDVWAWSRGFPESKISL